MRGESAHLPETTQTPTLRNTSRQHLKQYLGSSVGISRFRPRQRVISPFHARLRNCLLLFRLTQSTIMALAFEPSPPFAPGQWDAASGAWHNSPPCDGADGDLF
jgi:hypothetical protein